MQQDNKVKQEDAKKIALRGAVNRLLATSDGKLLFAYLCDTCGMFKCSMVYDPKTLEINERSTVYNEARRSVYIALRSYADPKALMDVEYSDTQTSK